MRLSVESYAVSELLGEEAMPRAIKDAGFDAVDYSFYTEQHIRSLSRGDGYVDYARRMRERLDEAGLACNQAHAPAELTPESRLDVSDPEYLRLVRSIEAAAILGADSIIVHPIPVDADDLVSFNVEFYKGLAPLCERFGIRISVENIYGCDYKRKRKFPVLGTPETLCAVIDGVGSPWFCACIDVGHTALTGYEPEDFIQRMPAGMIRALHVHDNDYREDLHLLPFSGKFAWEKIGAALKACGYGGDLTLEILSFLERFPPDVLPDALRLASSVGRKLISYCE